MKYESTFIICATVLIILTLGSPDLLDAIIAMVGGGRLS